MVDELRDVEEPGPDYVSLMPAAKNKHLVVVMRYSHTQREYVIHRCSDYALPQVRAESLAKSWAAALKVEVR